LGKMAHHCLTTDWLPLAGGIIIMGSDLGIRKPLTQTESRREFRRRFEPDGKNPAFWLLSVDPERVWVRAKLCYFLGKIAKKTN
jgi:hypothetical protein